MKNYFIILFLITYFMLPNTAYTQYQKVESHSLDIYYRVFGEGQPVLILGGGPGDVSDRYLSLCELLSKKFQCILVDQRGTGKSSPAVYDSSSINVQFTLEDFEAIRNQLGFDTWNVLGFSYGGFLASLYANEYPESILKLILLDSMGLNTDVFVYFRDNIFSRMDETDKQLFKFWSDSTRLANDTQHALTERIKSMMPGYFYDREKSFFVSQSIKDTDFNFEMGNWMWKDIVKRNLDLAEMPSIFKNPVLILQGRQDPLGDSLPLKLADYYENSEYIFIEKAGHYSWIEQPDKVFGEISNFMKE